MFDDIIAAVRDPIFWAWLAIYMGELVLIVWATVFLFPNQAMVGFLGGMIFCVVAVGTGKLIGKFLERMGW